ncbi:MAG: hypothetical protein BWY99_02143 [Synergistetes bacterium ADurb.BinA166]|nr:MAG: hypothetical protein BWY99_02143 [Synergistetes bacterium ADurb.BinA166]
MARTKAQEKAVRERVGEAVVVARLAGATREEFLSLAAAAWDQHGTFTEDLARECGARGMAVRSDLVRDGLHVWFIGRPGETGVEPRWGSSLLHITSKTGGLPAYVCCFEDEPVLCCTLEALGAELDRILSHPDVVRFLGRKSSPATRLSGE